MVYTGVLVLPVCIRACILYQYSCPSWYTWLFPESTLESAEVPWRERTFLIHMADTWNRVNPSSKYQRGKKKNQVCGDTSVYVSERQMSTLMLMLSYVNSAIRLSDLQETLQTCQHVLSAAIPCCCFFCCWWSSLFSNWPYSTFGSRIHW